MYSEHAQRADRAHPSPRPTLIEQRRSSRMLALTWGERAASLSHRTLRLACRCADCESLRRRGTPAPVPEEVELMRIELVGQHGLRLFFSDGHDRGIFPWAYLYRLAFSQDEGAATGGH